MNPTSSCSETPDQTIQNRREHYRISIPVYEKVDLVLGDDRHPVEEFSEKGVRFLADREFADELPITGELFHQTRKLFNVQGKVLRSEPLGRNRWKVVVSNQSATMSDVIDFQIHLIQNIPVPMLDE